MLISVASGKGGTGKTTVSVNLARILENVQLLDCDVEEPNANLFLKGNITKQETVTVSIPEIDKNICNFCGECSKFCQYNAIVSLQQMILIFTELCHSCGGCLKACPNKAIREVEKRIGVVKTLESNNITLVQGSIDVGVAMVTPVIKAVKKLAQNKIVILDAPPGTSCPVITTIEGSDFVVLVTEPTPFGMNDLKLAVEMVKKIDIPFGIVINRLGIGDDRIHVFCKQQNIPILLEIPDDRRIAQAYSRGEIIVDSLPEYRNYFENLWKKIVELQKKSI